MADSPDRTNTFSGWAHASPGLGSVGSYQIAGTPYLSGNTSLNAETTDEIIFPAVTKRVVIRNTSVSSSVRVHFRPTSSFGRVNQGFHYMTVQPLYSGSTTFDHLSEIDMNIKCDHIFVTNPTDTDGASYQVFAELTGINRANMFELTGSGITE